MTDNMHYSNCAWIEGYEAYLTSRYEGNTVNKYVGALRRFLRWLQPIDVRDTTPDHIKSFLAMLSHPQTANFYLVAFRSFFKANIGGIVGNPTIGIRGTPVVPESVVKRGNLLPDEEALLVRELRASGNRRNQAIVELVRLAGLRRGEVRRLQKQDVDLENGLILVRTRKRGLVRVVPMIRNLRTVLQEYEAAERPQTHYFPGRGSLPISLNSINYIFDCYRKRTGIEHLGPDVVRNTYEQRVRRFSQATTSLNENANEQLRFLELAFEDVIQIHGTETVPV